MGKGTDSLLPTVKPAGDILHGGENSKLIFRQHILSEEKGNKVKACVADSIAVVPKLGTN